MKHLSFNLLTLAVLTVGLALASCGNKGGGDAATPTKTEQKSDKADKTGKEYTSAYVCPMHCKGSGSDAPGKCPVCKMDYVKNDGKSNGHDGHDHDEHDHHGHEH